MTTALICRCGESNMTFQHLKESDFPLGWEADCCATAQMNAEVAAEIAEVPKLTEQARQTPQKGRKK